MKRSTICLWGERGLIVSFFVDMHLCASSGDWRRLLNSIHIQAPTFPRDADQVTVIVEGDFGNRGFGHPDAILIVSKGDERFVAIFEAKRTTYHKSCRKERSHKYYNSSLRGQLELNYIFTVTLSDWKSGTLTAPEWIDTTPYARGIVRWKRPALKSKIVTSALVSQLSGLPLSHYFHIVMTTDASNPFLIPTNKPHFPEIYGVDAPLSDTWSAVCKQFGWINYNQLLEVTDQLASSEPSERSNLFAATFQLNKPNLSFAVCRSDGKPASKNSVLVHLPAVNDTTFLHCSYQGLKCKLRNYIKLVNGEPSIDDRFTTDEILSAAVRVIKARRVPIANIEFWHDEIERANAKYLSHSN